MSSTAAASSSSSSSRNTVRQGKEFEKTVFDKLKVVKGLICRRVE